MKPLLRNTLVLLFCLIAPGLGHAAANPEGAPEKVVVLGYDFPPFVYAEDGDGLTNDFLNLLNRKQSDYLFRLHIASPMERYREFQNGRADLILFEMPEWEWRARDIAFESTASIIAGREVYIAKRAPGRSQAYFETLKDKHISAVRGYHYGFADFQADPDWLHARFDITLTDSLRQNIHNVLKGHTEVSVVPSFYLRIYFLAHRRAEKQILVSERMDQLYRLRALARRGGPISAQAFEDILRRLKEDGTLDGFFLGRRLQDMLVFH